MTETDDLRKTVAELEGALQARDNEILELQVEIEDLDHRIARCKALLEMTLNVAREPKHGV